MRRVYSLIRPLRIGFRRICCGSMSVTAAGCASRSLPGTCWAMPWCGRVRVTHRFHPLFGRDFGFVAHRHNWDEDRVHLHDENGVLFSLPTGWTDVSPVLSWSSRTGAARSQLAACRRWRI